MSVADPSSRVSISVIKALSTKCDSSDAICHYLAASPTAAADVDQILQAIASTADLSKRAALIEAVLNIMSMVDLEESRFPPEQLMQFVRIVAARTPPVVRFEPCSLIMAAIRKVADMLSVTMENQIRDLLRCENRSVAVLIVAVFAEKFDGLRQGCVEEAMTGARNPRHVVAIVALATILKLMNEETAPGCSVEYAMVHELVKRGCLQNADVFTKQATIMLLTSTIIYFSEERVMAMYEKEVVANLMYMAHHDYESKRLVFEHIAAMKASDVNGRFTVPIQVTTLVPELCSSLREHEKEFMPKFMEFVDKRKGCAALAVTLRGCSKMSEQYMTAAMVGMELGVFADTDVLHEFFPVNVSENMATVVLQLVPIVAGARTAIITNQNVQMVVRSVFAVTEIPSYLSSRDKVDLLAAALVSLVPFVKEVIDGFLMKIGRISRHVLEMICGYVLKHGKESDIPERDFSAEYCTCVAVLMRFIVSGSLPAERKAIYVDFLALLSGRFRQDTARLMLPATISMMISKYIPDNLRGLFMETCSELIHRDATFAVCCAGIPGWKPGVISDLIKAVNARSNVLEFPVFYATFASVSASEAIGFLDTHVKELRGTGFTGIFKRAPTPEATTCVLEALCSMVIECNLKKSELVSIVNMASFAIPKKSEELIPVRLSARKLVVELSKKSGLKMPEDLVESWIQTPLYIDALPGLLLKVSGNDSRLADATQAWAIRVLDGNPVEASQTEAVVESIFAFRGHAKTLDIVMQALMRYFISDSNNIEIFRFANTVVVAAQRKSWRYTKVSPVLLEICAPYVLSSSHDFRVTVTEFLLNLFGISAIAQGLANYSENLPFSEAADVFVRLYESIFKIVPETIFMPVFQRTISLVSIMDHHVLLIRAMLNAHSGAPVAASIPAVVKLCGTKVKKGNVMVVNRIERILVECAKVAPNTFVQLLCTVSSCPLVDRAIANLMMHESVRNDLVSAYIGVLSAPRPLLVSSGAFSLLSVIGNADLGGCMSGKIVICCVMWIARIFVEKLRASNKDLNKISQVIAQTIHGVPREFVINSMEDLVNVIGDIVGDLDLLDAGQLRSAIECAGKIASGNCEYGQVAVGTIFVGMLNRYGACTTHNAKELLGLISSGICDCFTHGTVQVIRQIAFVMDKSLYGDHLKCMSMTEQGTMLQRLAVSVSAETELYRSEATAFLCWFATALPSSTLSVHSVDVVDALQKAFNRIPPTMGMMSAVLHLITNGIRVMGPTNTTKLNTVYLIFIAASMSEVHSVTVDCMLRLTCKDEFRDAMHALFANLDDSGKRLLRELLLSKFSPSNVQSVTDELFRVALLVVGEFSGSDPAVASFLRSIGEVCVCILSSENHPCYVQAGELLRRIN